MLVPIFHIMVINFEFQWGISPPFLEKGIIDSSLLEDIEGGIPMFFA